MPKKKEAYFRRFSAKEPRHLETIFAKKRYTSIVALVMYVSLRSGSLQQKKNVSYFREETGYILR